MACDPNRLEQIAKTLPPGHPDITQPDITSITAEIYDVNNPIGDTILVLSDPPNITNGDEGIGGDIVIDTLKGNCEDYVDPLTLGPGTHFDFSGTQPDYSNCFEYGKVIVIPVINDNPDEATIEIELVNHPDCECV
jgi:hypothetical protein